MFDKFLTEQELNNFFIDFAEDAIYDNGRDSPIYIKVIFEANNKNNNIFDNNISGTYPTAYIKNLDIESYNISKETIIKIRNIDYFVENIESDSDGISLLILKINEGD